MDIMLSIDDEIARKAQKIAAEKNTTLSAMVQDYLTSVANDETPALDAAARKEAADKLRETINRIKRPMGPRNWTRDDLYDRFDHKYQR